MKSMSHQIYCVFAGQNIWYSNVLDCNEVKYHMKNRNHYMPEKRNFVGSQLLRYKTLDRNRHFWTMNFRKSCYISLIQAVSSLHVCHDIDIMIV